MVGAEAEGVQRDRPAALGRRRGDRAGDGARELRGVAETFVGHAVREEHYCAGAALLACARALEHFDRLQRATGEVGRRARVQSLDHAVSLVAAGLVHRRERKVEPDVAVEGHERDAVVALEPCALDEQRERFLH